MKITLFFIIIIASTLCLSILAQDSRPGNLPPGHPSLPSPDIVPANPADVASLDAIVNAYYDAISGPKGEPRDWNRFRSLFLPGARFITMRPAGRLAAPLVLTVDQFIATNRNYFEKGGYFETEIHRQTESYGRIAQVFSTYGSRRARQEPQPYARGINGFQLLNDGQRWWIAQIIWEIERPEENPLPDRYIPESP